MFCTLRAFLIISLPLDGATVTANDDEPIDDGIVLSEIKLLPTFIAELMLFSSGTTGSYEAFRFRPVTDLDGCPTEQITLLGSSINATLTTTSRWLALLVAVVVVVVSIVLAQLFTSTCRAASAHESSPSLATNGG